MTLLAACWAARASGDPTDPVVSDTGWDVHAQSTFVEQGHFAFPAEYSGPNSLGNASQAEHTFSFSLYLGRKLWEGAALYYDPEVFQGYGLSGTFGVAGFPNGEAVKAGFANLHYNTSRLFIRQNFGLGGPTEKLEDDQNQFAETVDVNRIVVSVGKFSANDFFDDNAYSHDSRTQFLNWALWESAAWDYPADVVGFTAGAVVEWNSKIGTLHYGIFMEPTVPNGASLDPHLGDAFGQILEYDWRYQWDGKSGTVRPFAYWNRAHMGSYALADEQSYPANVSLTRAYRSKVGTGVSWDQTVGSDFGVFVRLSWDDGREESWAFTEIDRSAATGLSLKGVGWGRAGDTLGIAAALNGLSNEHRRYLADGGTGLLLGDGHLDYGPEQIVEAYYDIRLPAHLHLSPDWQYLERPGYNRDRGGVAVYSVRLHANY